MSNITCDVPQGSFAFSNLAIKYCKVHQLADDTNLLNINKSPQKINKLMLT